MLVVILLSSLMLIKFELNFLTASLDWGCYSWLMQSRVEHYSPSKQQSVIHARRRQKYYHLACNFPRSNF